MPNITSDVLSALNLLLPGFVAAWVFYGMTAYPRASPFEQVIQALVYNVILRPFVLAVGGLLRYAGDWHSFGPWTVESELTTAVILAFPLGAVFAGIANSDVLHRSLRERNFFLRRVAGYGHGTTPTRRNGTARFHAVRSIWFCTWPMEDGCMAGRRNSPTIPQTGTLSLAKPSG